MRLYECNGKYGYELNVYCFELIWKTIKLLMCLGCRWIESVLIGNGMESVLTCNGDFEWFMES